MRYTELALAIGMSGMAAFSAATPAQKPAFEVVSVKKTTNPFPINAIRLTGNRFVGGAWTLMNLLATAYRPSCDSNPLLDSQISGAPPWASSEGFDIEGTAAEGVTLDRCQVQLMLKYLLMTRFQLSAHTEIRDLPVYQLVVVRPGKLKLSEDQTPTTPRTTFPDGRPLPSGTFSVTSGGHGSGMLIISGTGVRMSRLITVLQSTSAEIRDRVIIDKTGLDGLFEVNIQFAEPPSAEQPAVNAAYPLIFTAIQEQLGLKLEKSRGPVDVLVIHSVQRPSEN